MSITLESWVIRIKFVIISENVVSWSFFNFHYFNPLVSVNDTLADTLAKLDILQNLHSVPMYILCTFDLGLVSSGM